MEYAVEEAETKGKAEGERLATLRNARNMKKAGVDLSLIAECTGLSLEIIQSLWSDSQLRTETIADDTDLGEKYLSWSVPYELK